MLHKQVWTLRKGKVKFVYQQVRWPTQW